MQRISLTILSRGIPDASPAATRPGSTPSSSRSNCPISSNSTSSKLGTGRTVSAPASARAPTMIDWHFYVQAAIAMFMITAPIDPVKILFFNTTIEQQD